jgi:hypothetical protein
MINLLQAKVLLNAVVLMPAKVTQHVQLQPMLVKAKTAVKVKAFLK